jgi:hypothetical protein
LLIRQSHIYNPIHISNTYTNKLIPMTNNITTHRTRCTTQSFDRVYSTNRSRGNTPSKVKRICYSQTNTIESTRPMVYHTNK